jgi:C4-dicarboxylate transporter DctM subunit
MIIYGAVTGISIGALFLGGVVPGILIGGGFMLTCYLLTRKGKYVAAPRPPASWGEVWDAFREASLALMLPVVILGAIITGVCTATEAGAVAAVASFILGVFVYKEIKLSEIMNVVLRSMSSTAVVMLMCATSTILGWLMAKERFGDLTLTLMRSITTNPMGMLAVTGVVLLLVGTFLDVIPMTIILMPILHPLLLAYGFDSIHFGVIAVILITVGSVTPPVAPVLYIASTIAKSDAVAAMPLVCVFIGITLVVTAALAVFPPLVTFLPNLFFK